MAHLSRLIIEFTQLYRHNQTEPTRDLSTINATVKKPPKPPRKILKSSKQNPANLTGSSEPTWRKTHV
ncbi:hypothetical protein N9Y92_03160 [Chlamydiales bacterium]|nr:hypothetical protein [Chlamydiales bacterium]